MLTFHLLLAKFFLICSLTDWWIFLSRAVSPAILEWEGMERAGGRPGAPRSHPSIPFGVGTLTMGVARLAHK